MDAPLYPHIPPVPAGKVRLANYGTVTEHSVKTVLDSAFHPGKRRTYTLTHSTRGYEIAGSVLRWTEEYWAVQFEMDGSTHGHRYSNEQPARELFRLWTTENL